MYSWLMCFQQFFSYIMAASLHDQTDFLALNRLKKFVQDNFQNIPVLAH